jgi:hypothetical protein
VTILLHLFFVFVEVGIKGVEGSVDLGTVCIKRATGSSDQAPTVTSETGAVVQSPPHIYWGSTVARVGLFGHVLGGILRLRLGFVFSFSMISIFSSFIVVASPVRGRGAWIRNKRKGCQSLYFPLFSFSDTVKDEHRAWLCLLSCSCQPTTVRIFMYINSISGAIFQREALPC